ncbi:nucleic acid-binding protein [Violaceomyces palustris]|uniref:Nucleic acid-binding protein n=1 Tax=Violaceomyces palustris TaxID=1673888 RepID=A0ACD0NX81_9BASI|nr:nucleic acid-binding protein [Violaceomyces palustris]
MPANTLSGIVTKAGVMAKTVTMTVERRITHPKLLKTYLRHKKYLVHDPESTLSVGDRIVAQSCRPLSARKRYTLLNRVGKESTGQFRREKAEAMMSAVDREKIRIEQLVKDEVAKKSGGGGESSDGGGERRK